jgi:2-polyprenyl-3-methyl-5-hydroxy-6-metoxy-1,4-benzoquinol methylase
MIRDQETATYQDIWALEAYHQHSPGESYVETFCEMPQVARLRQIVPVASVLDAGCGAGKGALALKATGYDVFCADLVDVRQGAALDLPFRSVCLWDDLKVAMGREVDWVYCCDVLEHIPTPFTMLTVSQLLKVARWGVFLSISLQPDVFGAWVGKPLHQTVQSFTAWRDQLAELGTVTEARDLLTTGLYLVVP